MAAEVGRQIKNEGKSGCPITRDFLGGCSGSESKELDLDLHVPVGWEKRLDLKSGKVYLQRSNQPSPSDHNRANQTLPSAKTPSKPKTTLNLFEDTSLDLKLVPNSPSNLLGNYGNASYQSVCTLDKVKSALDRQWRVSSSSPMKRPSPSTSASSSMITINNNNDDDSKSQSGSDDNGPLVAGACPSCLLYVLMSQTNPKCPKCNSAVPLPPPAKKPKIDLNVSM